MGNTPPVKMKPLKGLEVCPYVGFNHNSNDHQNEFDTCNVCEEFRECSVSCCSPKSGEISKVCLRCGSQGQSKYKRLSECKSCHESKLCYVLDIGPPVKLEEKCINCSIEEISFDSMVKKMKTTDILENQPGS